MRLLWTQFLCLLISETLADPCSNHSIENGTTISEASGAWECLCPLKNCLRKCCADGQSFVGAECVDNPGYQINITIFDGTKPNPATKLRDFRIIHGKKCPENYVRFSPEAASDVFLQANGSLLVESFEQFYPPEEFCIDLIDNETSALLCEVLDSLSSDERQTFAHGMIISMPFLLLTFLVYAILPETSLHRKALMSYVLTLFAGYVFLVVTQLSNSIPNELCHVMGYSIIFFFTVSFFWMNVMCIDMWLAFSGMKVYNGMRGTEKKRFLFYCLYAWGVPLLHVFIVFMINTFGDKTSVYYPHLGTKRCYVEDGLPELFYFYLPMAIVIVINIVLFILTTVRIQQVKRETAMLKHTDSKRHSYEDDKQKFNLYLKLMLAMGINWSMEVISWAVTWKLTKAPTWIWYLTDFTNATYGAVIFFIFVFKKKIWISLKKRYYVWMGKPHLAHAMSRTTHGTRTSNFSTTDTTTVNNDYRMSNMKNGREEERALN